MRLVSPLPAIFLLALCPLISAQQPPSGEPAAKPPVATKPVDLEQALSRVLVTGDTLAMGPAVRALVLAGKDGRTSLRVLLDRVAPAATALPPVAEGTKPDPKVANEPLDEATKTVVEDLLSKDPAKADAAGAKLAEGATTSTEQVRKVVVRSNAILTNYILRTFRDHADSGAIFAGQYAALKELGPVALETVGAWLVKPPPGGNAANLRVQCIRVIRDLVEDKPDERLAKSLQGIAAEAAATDLQRQARYALAQFGDRSFIDPHIQKLEQQIEGDDDAIKGTALAELADTHYQMRDYKSAAEVFKRQIAMLEAGKVDRKSVVSVPTLYYNACCSMALAGMIDDAFVHLEKAIEEGRKGQPLGRKLLEVDMDIEVLRQDARFAKVMAAFDGKK